MALLVPTHENVFQYFQSALLFPALHLQYTKKGLIEAATKMPVKMELATSCRLGKWVRCAKRGHCD